MEISLLGQVLDMETIWMEKEQMMDGWMVNNQKDEQRGGFLDVWMVC